MKSQMDLRNPRRIARPSRSSRASRAAAAAMASAVVSVAANGSVESSVKCLMRPFSHATPG